ncbi:MAG: YncE family protein [Candidatus Sericytochromatia bacterium]|nr:YncE family protein [Candidatus Sericytochromatia bacterium]
MQTQRRWAIGLMVAALALVSGCPNRLPTDPGETVAALIFALVPEGQEVGIIDLRVNRLATALSAGGVPSGLAVTPYGRLLLISNETTHTVRTYQQRDYGLYNPLGDIGVGRNPQQIVMNAPAKEAVVAVAGDRRIAVVDVSLPRDRPTLKGIAPMSDVPVGVAVSSDGAVTVAVSATQLYRVQRSSAGVYTAAAVTLPTATDRRLVSVAMWRDQSVLVDAQRNEMLIVAADGTARTVDLKRNGQAAQPGKVIVNLQGTKLYVACPGTNTIAVVDPAAGTVLQHAELGSAVAMPFGLAVTPDGTRLYASMQVGRQLAIFDTSPDPAVTTSLNKAIGLSSSAGGQVPLSEIVIARPE